MHVFRRGIYGSRKGFSLVESIIAMALTTFMIMVFGAAFPYASQTISRAKHIDMATNSCDQELEVYRNAGYNSCPRIASGTASTYVNFTPPSDIPNASGRVTFTRVDESFNTTTTDTGRMRVEAVISWSGFALDRGNVSVVTLILR